MQKAIKVQKIRYRCHLYHFEDMDEYCQTYKDVQSARIARLKEYINRYSLFTEHSKDAFLSYYEKACDVEGTAYYHAVCQPERKQLCKNCSAVMCGDCKRVATFYGAREACDSCRKMKSNINRGLSSEDCCFFASEFYKVNQFRLEAREIELSPQIPPYECQQCHICTAEPSEVSEEVKLCDIPLNGYPTKVIVTRRLYESQAKFPCPKKPLPDVQNNVRSTMTPRLIKRILDGYTARCPITELSEWYDVRQNLIYKLKNEQSDLVAQAKGELRKSFDSTAQKIMLHSGTFCGKPAQYSFSIPMSCDAIANGDLELIGIYSNKEWAYLTDGSFTDFIAVSEYDFNHAILFMAAFDFATLNWMTLPYVFACILAMANTIKIVPGISDSFYRTFPALFSEVLKLIKRPATIDLSAVNSLINIALYILNEVPSDADECAFTDYVRRLYHYLIDIRINLWSLPQKPWLFCNDDILEQDSTEEITLIQKIVHQAEQLQPHDDFDQLSDFDVLRNDILFFNPVVLPTVVRNDGEVAPMYFSFGDVDTTKIHSIGIRCECLLRLLDSMNAPSNESQYRVPCQKMFLPKDGKMCYCINCDKKCRERYDQNGAPYDGR